MPGIDPNFTPGSANSGSTNPLRAGPSEDVELAQQLAQLPAYARSLLRIQVPVVASLATTRQPVGRVLELAPGTILHFNKPCDDPLSLHVGSCEVAVGETVKVGEKFGLKISSMVLPKERFEKVRPKNESPDAGTGDVNPE